MIFDREINATPVLMWKVFFLIIRGPGYSHDSLLIVWSSLEKCMNVFTLA